MERMREEFYEPDIVQFHGKLMKVKDEILLEDELDEWWFDLPYGIKVEIYVGKMEVE